MPKHGILTPKAIANRIKAKGLQKLRWYCQMCQKQCRDENGFKCHTMSESHQRQLLLFAENPDKYVDHFSQEFMDTFMELLRRRFGTKRVHANQVYQEYIADRNHLHMNSTQWETLTEFVKWLGREGHCVVDETEKGWFISYIDRDPETIRRQESLAKSEKMKLHDEERMAQFIQRQMERDKERTKEAPETVFTDLKKESEEEKVAFSLKTSTKKVNPMLNAKKNPLASTSKSSSNQSEMKKSESGNKRKLALEEIIEQEQKSREKASRKDYWLCPGIVVKIISKKYGGDVFKKKGVVKDVKDRYKGVVKLLDSGEKFEIDQADLETVIPAIGRQMLVLNGAYRGSKTVLLDINMEKFCVKVQILSGPFKGKTLENMAYEDISKLHLES